VSDHSLHIERLREQAQHFEGETMHRLAYLASADLLKVHDETGISLDEWTAVRALVEYCLGRPITRNGV
jgi:hypothetical protein